ncbi:MAG: hypothetical protein EPO24_09030 [Bacteroidetes bacterium]|nr:MAG: hypothetical protein EPO24_09030 [Bacteroidota bacterium]
MTGYFGGAVFLTIWASVLLLSIYPSKNSGSFIANPDKDVLGMSTTLTSIVTEIKEQHRDYREQVYFGLTVKNRNIIEEPVRWEGIEWTMNGMFPRILWMGGSFIFMIASGLIFFRFDPAREPRKKADALVRAQTSYRVQEINIIFPVVQKYITPMFSLQRWYRFKTMFIVEMKKMVKDTAWWWFLGMAILIVVCAVSPFDIMREWLLPTAWIWPLFVWSKLGMRVSGHFRNRRSNPDAQYDSLFMQVLWVMGVLVTMAAGSGAAARFILAGDWPTLFAWIICAGFIPSLSFVLSIWTASSYVFEGTYVLLWLVGSVSKQPLLDFMGTLQDSIAVQNPFLYFIWTIALITFAAVGKQRLLEK